MLIMQKGLRRELLPSCHLPSNKHSMDPLRIEREGVKCKRHLMIKAVGIERRRGDFWQG